MKQRILFLLTVFVATALFFAVQKPMFMLYNWSESSSVSILEWLAVVWHGLSLDFTVAGYLTVIPLLMTIASVWITGDWWKRVFNVYFIIVSIVISTVFVVNMALYPFWGYGLDSSIFFYLNSPKDAVASVSVWLIVRQTIFAVIYGSLFCWVFRRWVTPVFNGSKPRLPITTTLSLLLFGGLLFLPIRGGLSASTANEGRAYFSSNMFLNHAAVNPCFSLIASSLQQQTFSEQFRFFDEEQRASVFEEFASVSQPQATDTVLTTERPNIIFIILESFSANAIEVLGGDNGVTPRINALSREGILFSNIYASSFRTDRGLVSVLNGYPGQPTTSIMKYPIKSKALPAIAGKLRSNGYSTAMYYGGDIDFTNMRSYFYASGYETVVGQDKLSFTEEISRWGYNDALMFDYVFDQVRALPEPFLATLLTLSSHEPFDVPFAKLDNPYLNSMAFTDHCIGEFIDSLKRLPIWDRTLVVMVSDHGYRYPESIGNNSVRKQHIPMLWLGGALNKSAVVDLIASQTDIAATLLTQLNIDVSDFRFSRNILDPSFTPGAIYTFNNGVGVIDSAGYSVCDFTTGALIESSEEGAANDKRIERGKAYVQTLMEDFDKKQ